MPPTKRGTGEGARNPQSEQSSSASPPGRHAHPQPRKPPPTRNWNHPTRATHRKQEPQATHRPSPLQQEPYQGPHQSPPLQQEPHHGPHHPPEPHQQQTHHPRTPQRNSSQKKHQHTPHLHIPLPTYEEMKHPYS
ncbi:uncharacterized protein [Procambarus clarkii]|uniref:uncharacterized protein n=1 Tax=Procambarus clarkii TaxID=6728 RepID=UPI00374293A0